MDSVDLTRTAGRQGWGQIINTKQSMLARFDEAKRNAESQAVRVLHGKVAEALVREWLGTFLPKRFGVTSGRIICDVIEEDRVAPHFDVVIYNQLDSPILWTEANPDESDAGRVRAIPVEHVRAVFEVKSRLKSRTLREALRKLGQLKTLSRPCIRGVDSEVRPSRPVQTGLIFFEMVADDNVKPEILDRILKNALECGGFLGGMVLRGSGIDPMKTATIHGAIGESDFDRCMERQSLWADFAMSRSAPLGNGKNISIIWSWSLSGFALFAQALVADLTDRPLSGYGMVLPRRIRPETP